MPKQPHSVRQQNNIILLETDAKFFFERGKRFLQKQHFEKALKYFKRCVDLDPRNSNYIFHVALVYTELGEYHASNKLLHSIINGVDGTLSNCYYFLAHNYAHVGEWELAEKYALLYLNEEPSGTYHEEAEEIVDFVCYELDREPSQYTQESKLITKHEQAKNCLEQGKFLEASRLLEHMTEEYPTFLAARNNLALCYYYLGRFDQALEVIQQILQQDQGNLHALCNLAVFLKHQGKKAEVQKLLDALCKVLPYQLDQHYKLATTLGILGEDERAYALFRYLLRRGQRPEPSIFHYLAIASYNTGRIEQALDYWEVCQELDPESRVADYFLERISADKQAFDERLSYHYQLPYGVELEEETKSKQEETDAILYDPMIRSSLFWAIQQGERMEKIRAIQSLTYIADNEAKEMLYSLIIDPSQDDFIKELACYVLHQVKLPPLYREVRNTMPKWAGKSARVIKTLCDFAGLSMEHELLIQAIEQWINFVNASAFELPTIRKAEGWAAATEWLVYQALKQTQVHTKTAISEKYGITQATLEKNIDSILQKISIKGEH